MHEMFVSVGLMSGTSLDGIDAAVIRTDGKDRIEFVEAGTIAYEAAFRNSLRVLLGDGAGDAHVEQELTDLHAMAVEQVLWKTQIEIPDVDIVGFHGHTIFHDPAGHRTVQLGDGQRLANRLGIPVVCDFRSADMEAGGQGAPLAPVYHHALAKDLAKPLAVVNIGGVANITWIEDGGPEHMIAFDTGPGNALIDDWVLTATGQNFDDGGRLASSGTPDQAIVEAMLGHPYFQLPVPKSLDRDDFANLLAKQNMKSLSAADGAATLTRLTVETIVQSARFMPGTPETWVVTGGGRKNTAIMRMLRHQVPGMVKTTEDVGWRGDSLEAEAFAYMAARHVHGLPISFPGTTGTARPMPGGVMFRPG